MMQPHQAIELSLRLSFIAAGLRLGILPGCCKNPWLLPPGPFCNARFGAGHSAAGGTLPR